MDLFFCWWITLVSSPISPRSFIIILRFLISHKAQRWSSSDNCCMASELYRSTSKQFLKESLNIHLGLVAKTVLIALPARVIYLSVPGPSFFFSGKAQVSSELESLVTAVPGMTKEPQGCWLGLSGACLRFAVAQLLWGQLGADTTRALPPRGRWQSPQGAELCPHTTQRSLGYSLRNQISLQFWNASLSVKERVFFLFCGNQTLEYTEFVS